MAETSWYKWKTCSPAGVRVHAQRMKAMYLDLLHSLDFAHDKKLISRSDPLAVEITNYAQQVDHIWDQWIEPGVSVGGVKLSFQFPLNRNCPEVEQKVLGVQAAIAALHTRLEKKTKLNLHGLVEDPQKTGASSTWFSVGAAGLSGFLIYKYWLKPWWSRRAARRRYRL